ncbi:MAG: TetR/AcrR family transcriptional regulator [Acidimicrobiales bacterium]|nr:TetR/AcrR family transcriptional regulator [Acidimicrobiales bacterium]
MRDRIVEAALRVLREDGPLGFTTTKVADEAGISVGSLYQYFPNKHAIVVALHDQDVREGLDRVTAILDDDRWSPRRKLTELTRWFFASEAEEAAALGVAMGDIELFLRQGGTDAATTEARALAFERCAAFLATASPTLQTADQVRFATELAITTVESVAKAVAARPDALAVNRTWADALSGMLAEHFDLHDEPPT